MMGLSPQAVTDVSNTPAYVTYYVGMPRTMTYRALALIITAMLLSACAGVEPAVASPCETCAKAQCDKNCEADSGATDDADPSPATDVNTPPLADAGAPDQGKSSQAIEPAATEKIDPLDAATGLVLDQIEQAAAQVTTLAAEIRYDRVQELLGDQQRRFGSLMYQRSQPPPHEADATQPELSPQADQPASTGSASSKSASSKFAIVFDRLLIDDTVRKIDQRFIFDGMWLLEIDGEDRTATRRKISDDTNSGNPLPGDHPLMLAVEPTRDGLVRHYKITLIDDAKVGNADADADASTAIKPPADSVHLRLKPLRKDSDMAVIDLWFDKTSFMPTQAATFDTSDNRSIFTLMKLKADANLADGAFDTALPKKSGWQTQTIDDTKPQPPKPKAASMSAPATDQPAKPSSSTSN